MQIIALDFESYYDQQYSLRKMTPAQYILDPRFEAIGCAVREGHPSNQPTYWVDGPDLQRFFDQADPEAMYFSHNWGFDGCIAAWRYGFVPKRMSCTLSISRALLAHQLRSLSLETVVEHLGLGKKGDTVHKVLGMNLAAIKAAGIYEEYKEYSKNDADKSMAIFDWAVRGGRFPASELAVLDLVLRCAVAPRFGLDLAVLAEHKNDIRVKKDALIARIGMQRDADGKVPELMSNDKFGALLLELGVDPPTKVSPLTGKVTYAFSKTDTEFIDLQEHPDPEVQALIAARLGHKSTIEETRTERLISISQLDWPGLGQARIMPVPLRYSGAHTHRLSGDWKLNMQNLPARGGNNAIRRALIAPPGHKVVVVDSSQIEARITAWICGQRDLVEAFEQGHDVYSEFASEVFGYKVNRKLKTGDHEAHGFVGKTGILGLGFGVGWPKFQRTVKLDSKKFTGKEILLTDAQATGIVQTYRTKYRAISGAWRSLNNSGIPVLARGGAFTFGPCVFQPGAIDLPSGLQLKYHNLRHEDGNWLYTYGGKIKKLYGGALLENIVQALARIVTMDAAVRIQKRLAKAGIWLNAQVHDELVYIVPDKFVDVVKGILEQEMRRRPEWAPDLPLACEVGVGASYGDAK
jgi:hypothetical protein